MITSYTSVLSHYYLAPPIVLAEIVVIITWKFAEGKRVEKQNKIHYGNIKEDLGVGGIISQ